MDGVEAFFRAEDDTARAQSSSSRTWQHSDQSEKTEFGNNTDAEFESIQTAIADLKTDDPGTTKLVERIAAAGLPPIVESRLVKEIKRLTGTPLSAISETLKTEKAKLKAKQKEMQCSVGGAARYLSLDDFYAYMPMHNYIYTPTRTTWPAASFNARCLWPDEEVPPNVWLDSNKPVEQMTWAPGFPMIVKDKLILEGGWINCPGVQCFNLYYPPTIESGDSSQAGKWFDHTNYVFPNDAEHILDRLAHRVQRPQEKINHALVLGGMQGIGKDTILEPAKYAIGPWNFQEVSPTQILGRFNGFLKSVILRVSEARDLGEFDRFQLYDHMKAYIAAPPDVLRIDEKHLREHSIINCCDVIITTNHKTDGIFLPADDRRHYVAWSDRTKEDARFQGDYWSNLWAYYVAGGLRHVAAFVMQRGISEFNPKAPPPKTPALWAIVDSNHSPEESELADLLDALGSPDVVTLSRMQVTAKDGFADWLRDRKNRRVIPHRLEKCGMSQSATRAATTVFGRSRAAVRLSTPKPSLVCAIRLPR